MKAMVGLKGNGRVEVIYGKWVGEAENLPSDSQCGAVAQSRGYESRGRLRNPKSIRPREEDGQGLEARAGETSVPAQPPETMTDG